MVMVVRTPEIARRTFSANQLCCWPNGVKFTGAKAKKRKRRKQRPPEPEMAVPDWILNQPALTFGEDITN